MEMVKEVLQAYHVYPMETKKITDRLYRIKDGNHEYALKKSSLTEDSVKAWQRVYYIANEKNIPQVVPVYLTKEGKLYQKLNDSIFYLTPWLDNSTRLSINSSINSTMQSLAHLHEKTKQVQIISKKKLDESFHTYQQYSKDIPNELLSYVTQFENNLYMSPFELLVCTQFRDMEYAFNMHNARINEFLDSSDEEMNWSNSLCHGQLSPDHIINRQFINWESTIFDHPAVDLNHYITHLTGDFDQPIESIADGFKRYKANNDFTDTELKLLTIYLLNPTPYITTIRNYTSNITKEPMIDQVRQLQQQYRRLFFAMKFTEFIKDEFETISLDDLD